MEELIRAAQATRRLVLLAGGGLVGSMFLPRASASCPPEHSSAELHPRASGRVIRISPGVPLMSFAATCRAARDGDTIEVDPGDYRGDVSVWPQTDLTIRGIGVRPRLIADGRDAEGKGIMVLRGRRVRVENLEFRDARVRDRNGAGIRVEDGPLSVSNCAFHDNENGILVGNLPTIEIAIDHSVFVGNGHPDGSAHNLYVGTVAALHVTGCLFARSRVGHLLKSRAERSRVLYCRLTGEDGTSSYELEFPNGGHVTIVGNLIQQGALSENATIVSYGVEGYRWSDNVLTLAFNTLVNDRPAGSTFVRVAKGAQQVSLLNNVLVGAGSLAIDAPLQSRGNVPAARGEFADADRLDYRLRPKSRLIGRAGFRGNGDEVVPTREYVHAGSSCPLLGVTPLTPLSPGAFQRLAS